jgi:hypothetical protein
MSLHGPQRASCNHRVRCSSNRLAASCRAVVFMQQAVHRTALMRENKYLFVRERTETQEVGPKDLAQRGRCYAMAEKASHR